MGCDALGCCCSAAALWCVVGLLAWDETKNLEDLNF